MKQLPNIALLARTRAGKDTFFKVAEELGYNVRRVAYGDTMKRMFHNDFPMIPATPKPISLYQKYNFMREIDSEVFVRPTIGDVLTHKNTLAQYGLNVPAYIFTDVRQLNEHQACEQLGCVFVRVEADKQVRIARMKAAGEEVNEAILNAPTERAVDVLRSDYTVFNNGDYDYLKGQIKHLLELLEVTN